jgi:DNA-binding transcriptional regulator GbsR (MarR family)
MPTLSTRQRDLIERIGVLHDRFGMRPVEGRILGLLLVSGEPELTFDQIRETLDLSKSATSTALHNLQAIGSVEYRTRPGDRKRYFRKSYTDWEEAFVERGIRYLEIRHLLVEALEFKDRQDTESRESLERMIEFLSFLEESIDDAYQRWQDNKTKTNRPSRKPKTRQTTRRS